MSRWVADRGADVAIVSDELAGQYNRSGSQRHWTRGRGQKSSVPVGRKTHYGPNAGDGDTDSDGL